MTKTKQNNISLLLEVFAIITGGLYTILYIKGFQYCFVFALFSAGTYTYLCYKKHILAETFLQAFYVLFALYGWFNWSDDYGSNSYSITTHFVLAFSTLTLMIVTAELLKKKTKTKLPYLDSFTTLFSLTATWLMVNFIHENWIYWIAINSASIYLYYKRGLKLSMLLYAFYLYLAVCGYFNLPLFF